MKQNESLFNAPWFDLWQQQSKLFFSSVQQQMGDLFAHGTPDPQAHAPQIQAWIDALKNLWKANEMHQYQKEQKKFWKMIEKMCIDATDQLLKEWQQRALSQQPINNVRDLYELWLSCCHQQYQETLRKKAYQAAYGDYMQQMLKAWNQFTPRHE